MRAHLRGHAGKVELAGELLNLGEWVVKAEVVNRVVRMGLNDYGRTH